MRKLSPGDKILFAGRIYWYSEGEAVFKSPALATVHRDLGRMLIVRMLAAPKVGSYGQIEKRSVTHRAKR
jgi:hypothetical protein